MATSGRAAFSLMELMIVVSLMGILAALILPQFQPGVVDQLLGTADILAADLNYARNLAVTNGSQYKLTFSAANNQYYLEHSGTRSALNTLPVSPFHSTSVSTTKQTTKLSDLPQVAARSSLVAVYSVSGSVTAVSDIEFTALGATTRSAPTQIWLSAGSGSSKRYVSVTIDAVTGLHEVGSIASSLPSGYPSP